MSKYLITITADDNGVGHADAAHTMVRVDTSTGETRITELTVRAAHGGGLAPADLPPVDLDLLVRALTAPAPTPELTAAAAPAAEAVSPLPATEDAEPVPARRARKASGRRRAAGRTGTAKKTTRARKSTGRRRSQSAQEGGARPYRRMPDADEVLAAYQEIGTITGLAEHYGVPRHTATSWARRLRQQGHAIGRQ